VESSAISQEELQGLIICRAESELRVDIIHGESLNDPEYRIGDYAGNLIGAKSLKPYVVASFCGSSWTTGYREAPSGTVSFQEGVRFPLQRHPWSAGQERPLLQFKVFDKRIWQSWVGGDAYIGEGSLAIAEEELCAGNVVEKKVEIIKGKSNRGWLVVCVSLAMPSLMSVDEWLGM